MILPNRGHHQDVLNRAPHQLVHRVQHVLSVAMGARHKPVDEANRMIQSSVSALSAGPGARPFTIGAGRHQRVSGWVAVDHRSQPFNHVEERGFAGFPLNGIYRPRYKVPPGSLDPAASCFVRSERHGLLPVPTSPDARYGQLMRKLRISRANGIMCSCRTRGPSRCRFTAAGARAAAADRGRPLPVGAAPGRSFVPMGKQSG